MSGKTVGEGVWGVGSGEWRVESGERGVKKNVVVQMVD